MADNADNAKVGLGVITYGGNILGIITGDVAVTIGKEMFKLRAGVNGKIPLLTHKQWVVGMTLTLATVMKEITRNNLYYAIGVGTLETYGGLNFLFIGNDCSVTEEILEFIFTDCDGNQSGWHFEKASPVAETVLSYHEAEAADLPATWEASADLAMADDRVYGYYFEQVAAS